jgi:type IV secretory pathway VirB10-like protein
MRSIRTNVRAVRMIAVAIAVSAIAAPAASARFVQEPNQQLPVTPPTAVVVHSSPAQSQASPEVRPNPDQQTPQTVPVAPILQRVPASALAAVNRAKEHASAYQVPASGGYSTAGLDASATVKAPAVKAPTLSAPSNGFDWGDAAIGAGITAAIALMITAGSVAVRQRSEPRHS